MKIDATTFAKLPEHLQALFDKAPNPGRDEVVECFPMTKSGKLTPEMNVKASTGWSGGSQADRVKSTFEANTGSAARFFYAAKASKKDRDEGLEHIEATERVNGNKWTDQDYRVASGERSEGRESGPSKNIHPTVKPTDLMAYLCRLVTPPGGVVLDPFCGSGSTLKAALIEGFRCTGIEQDAGYLEIARARCAHALHGKTGTGKPDLAGGSRPRRNQIPETGECGEQGCLAL